MNLTPEQQALGRRNFLRAITGASAGESSGGSQRSAGSSGAPSGSADLSSQAHGASTIAGASALAGLEGPLRGGPVRVGFIGVGGEGRVLLAQTDPAFADVRALCDINPDQLQKADDVLAKAKRPAARHYAEWQDMLQREDLEAVVIAVPLWAHADVTVGCLDAGKHVLCEKMMAWDPASCVRMRDAAVRNKRILEIGYQRFYNPVYTAAYAGVIRAGLLGDVYHARLAWHRNGNWRRQGKPPSPGYDPSKWGYPTFEHLWNWRLYTRYSRGLLAELASHQVNVVNWFFDATPEAVDGTGGIVRFKDGREVFDHVYAQFQYPGNRTAVFSSIESNAFDDAYEAFFGTKGTLILRGETEAYLFEEGQHAEAGVPSAPAASETATTVANGANGAPGSVGKPAPGGVKLDRLASYRNEVSALCAAVRTGRPIACGPDRAMHSALACIRADEATRTKTRLLVAEPASPAVS